MSSSGSVPVQAHPLSTRVAVEGLGSFFIVFAGLGTALFSATGAGTGVGFAYGLAMVAAIISFGHISNGYFNPVFSLAMAVAGRLKYSAMALYVVAQTLGAVLASVVWLGMMMVLPAGATPAMSELFAALANGFDVHSPSQVPLIGVAIVEVVGAAILTALLLGVTSPRNKSALGPVAVGLAFAVAVGITMPLSNGSLNPARATSVVFVADSWALGQLWLFWVAPLVGAALVAAIHRAFAPSPVLAHDAGTSPEAASPAGDEKQDELPAAAAETTFVAPAPVPAAQVDDAQAFFDAQAKKQ